MAIASPRQAMRERSRSGALPQARKSSSSARARTRFGQSPGAPMASDWRRAAAIGRPESGTRPRGRRFSPSTDSTVGFDRSRGARTAGIWRLETGGNTRKADTVKVWDATKGQEIVNLKGKAISRSHGARTANVWPRGKRMEMSLAFRSWTPSRAGSCVPFRWTVVTDTRHRWWTIRSAWSPDGKRLASGEYRTGHGSGRQTRGGSC